MNNVKVGLFIKDQLKSKSITQEQLAEKLGISSSAVSQGLSGKNSFDIGNLMEISKILDLDLDIIVNAGEERETNLERVSKMTYEQYMIEDPSYDLLREKDSKGKELLDYLIKHENIELLKPLIQKGVQRQGRGNVLYLALLLKHYKYLGVPIAYFNRENGLPNFATTDKKILSKMDRKPYASRNKITEFDLLDSEHQKFVKVLLELNDLELLNHLPYFDKGIQDKVIPELLYYAVQLDKVEVVKYEEDVHEPYDSQLRNLQQRKYEELFQYAIKHQSKKCIKFYYDRLNTLKYQDIFKLLTDSGDLEFSKWFVDNFPEKSRDRFHQPQSKGIDNSVSLVELAKGEDMKLFLFSVLFSNQDALNKALSNIPQDKVEYTLALLKAGANYTYTDGYSGKPVELSQISETMRYILRKLDK